MLVVMAFEAFWRTLTKFERPKIAIEVAVRNTVGFIAAFAIGTWADSPGVGVLAGLGALNVAYSDSRDPYPIRARRMLISAVLSALAVAAGAVSGLNNFTAVSAAMLWAFGAGMLVALGVTAGDLGVVTLVTLVVFAARPLPPREALESGLVAFGGGILQALLAIAPWPVQRYEPERRIVASLYSSLALIARDTRRPPGSPPLGVEISDAHDKLGGLYHDHHPEAERLLFLLNQAERIRLSILTIARLARRIERDTAGAPIAHDLREVLHSAASAAERIGASAQTGVKTERLPPLRVVAALHTGGAAPRSPFFSALLADARQQIDALGGQLRSATKASAPEATGRGTEANSATFKARVQERLAKLRANFSLDSTVFRHALRLAVCLGIGDAAGRTLSLQRTYWIPMTIAIVLKPDFNGTVTRGVLRIAGTYAGLLLATLLFHFVHAGILADVVLMAMFTFLLRWVGPANYGIFVTALSAMVVLLIATTGVPPMEVIVARAQNTSIGGLLALFAYFAWPTWERASVGSTLADLLEAYKLYFDLVIAAYEHGSTSAVDAIRTYARRARSNAEASIDRLAAEPRTSPERLASMSAVLVNSHHFVHAVMALEAGLYHTGVAPARTETVAFSQKVDTTLTAYAAALRTGNRCAAALPDLRAAHNLMLQADAPSTERYTLVNTETDRIVTFLNSIGKNITPVPKKSPA